MKHQYSLILKADGHHAEQKDDLLSCAPFKYSAIVN